MIYANKNSKGKIIHVKKCVYVKNKAPKNVIVFTDMQDAFQKGYRLCKKCNPIKMQYLREEQAIINFAKANNLKVELCAQEIKIQSAFEQWKIVIAIDGRGTALYHKNTKNRYSDNYVPYYHNQGVEKSTILEYLSYISKHAVYKKNNVYKHDKEINKKNYIKLRKYKNKEKTQKRTDESKNNILQLLKRLHSEDVYKDFLCYVTG